MIYQLARTEVHDHVISTIYCPGLGYKGRDIYQTIIATIDRKSINKVNNDFRKITNSDTLALLAHEDAVTLANYILKIKNDPT